MIHKKLFKIRWSIPLTDLRTVARIQWARKRSILVNKKKKIVFKDDRLLYLYLHVHWVA